MCSLRQAQGTKPLAEPVEAKRGRASKGVGLVYAEALAKELSETNYEELKLDDNGMPKKTDEGYETEKYNLKVHCYLINLRGDVDHLSSFHKVKGKVEQLMQSDV